MSLCRSLLKENEIFPFIGMVPFLCTCVPSIPVRGLWEFLDILIIISIQLFFKNLFILYITNIFSQYSGPC